MVRHPEYDQALKNEGAQQVINEQRRNAQMEDQAVALADQAHQDGYARGAEEAAVAIQQQAGLGDGQNFGSPEAVNMQQQAEELAIAIQNGQVDHRQLEAVMTAAQQGDPQAIQQAQVINMAMQMAQSDQAVQQNMAGVAQPQAGLS